MLEQLIRAAVDRELLALVDAEGRKQEQRTPSRRTLRSTQETSA